MHCITGRSDSLAFAKYLGIGRDDLEFYRRGVLNVESGPGKGKWLVFLEVVLLDGKIYPPTGTFCTELHSTDQGVI